MHAQIKFVYIFVPWCLRGDIKFSQTLAETQILICVPRLNLKMHPPVFGPRRLGSAGVDWPLIAVADGNEAVGCNPLPHQKRLYGACPPLAQRKIVFL
jgi:hypothetical protein